VLIGCRHRCVLGGVMNAAGVMLWRETSCWIPVTFIFIFILYFSNSLYVNCTYRCLLATVVAPNIRHSATCCHMNTARSLLLSFTLCSLTVTATMRSSAVYCEVRTQGVMYTDSVLKWPCHVARLVIRRLGFSLGSVRVGFMVHEVAGIRAGFSPRTLVFYPKYPSGNIHL
jgi:hypothetical protein